MIFSDAFPVKIKGRSAQIRVVRNDAFCWGRIVYSDGAEFDIETRRDYYDHADEDAAFAFERAVRRGRLEEPLTDFRIGYSETGAES